MATEINRNPALGTSFMLEIPNAKSLNYFIQNTSLPGLNMGGVETPWTNHNAAVPSNRVEFDPLNLTFLVDEEWNNWEYIFEWMKRCRYGREDVTELMSDITLHLVNSNKNINVQIEFRGAFPTMVSELMLESSTVDSLPLVASVVFRYQDYRLVRPAK